jgi:eukaryotic-like serine/threonine-protein kinase
MGGPSLERGTVVGGDFVIARLLGQGGMGAVYLAEQKSTGKPRALKVMHREVAPDLTLQRRFEQEAKVGSAIKSGHIVEVIVAGVDAGMPYLVMELLEGVDLRRHLKQQGPLDAEEVRAIFEQLCHGVAAAHAAGIVHRDLKPENIFLARSNRATSGASVVKVLDFGIAKMAAEAGTRGTSAIGSPLWMAPEQTEPGPVTPACDVWALGLIAYELFTAKHFWRSAADEAATPMHLLREIVLEPIPLASERAGDVLPNGFDTWFRRCVARAPATRYKDAGEMWRAMQEFLPAPGSAPGSSVRVIHAETDPLAATATATADASPFELSATTGAPLGLSSARLPSDKPPVAETLPSKTTLRGGWLTAAGIGIAGLAVGVLLARHPETSASTPPPGIPVATTIATIPAMPVPPAVPVVPSPPPTSSVAPPPPVSPSTISPIASSAEKPAKPVGENKASGGSPSVRDGFANPHDTARLEGDEDAAQQLAVQGRHARLMTRLVSNGSNVIDSVVRGAIDHSAWHYLQCYQRTFASSKDLPTGTVTVGFDIVNQLPLHATLEASTFANPDMGPCVVRTLSGQTINAAGPRGAGHVVYAFWFLLTD